VNTPQISKGRGEKTLPFVRKATALAYKLGTGLPRLVAHLKLNWIGEGIRLIQQVARRLSIGAGVEAARLGDNKPPKLQEQEHGGNNGWRQSTLFHQGINR